MLEKLNAKYRSETCASGESLDTMKSALQKYCRRGNIIGGIQCVYELYMFNYLDDQRAKGIWTNVLHRLQVIFMEDIGPCSIGNIDNIFNLFNWLYESRESTDRSKEPEWLAKIIYIYCQSKRGRDLSHLRSVYNDNHIAKYAKYFPILENIRDEISKVVETRTELLFLNGEDAELVKNIRKAYNCLENNKWDNAFYYLHNVYLSDKKLNKQIFRSKSPVMLIFRALEEYIRTIDDDSRRKNYLFCLTMMLHWYKELKNIAEAWLTWAYVIKSFEHDFIKIDVPNIDNLVKIHDDIKNGIYLKINKEGHGILGLDDFVFDMHTKKGRNDNLGAAHFASNTALVTNEHCKINNDYKRVYIGIKFLTDGFTLEKFNEWEIQNTVKEEPKKPKLMKKTEQKTQNIIKEEPKKPYLMKKKEVNDFFHEKNLYKFIVRAQLVTSYAKQDTYYAINNETKKIVFVKGPFKYDIEPKITKKINDIKKYFVGIPSIKCDIKYLYDDLLESSVGLRVRLPLDKYYFIEFEDLCGFGEDVPRKIKDSKLWKNTEVVDWEHKGIKCREIKEDDLSDKVILLNFLKTLLFKYVIGISDLARRNFLLNTETKVVYSVDEDVIDKEITLDTFSNKIRDIIKKNIKNVDVSLWKESMIKNMDEIIQIVGEIIYKNILNRIDNIANYF